MLRAVHPEVLTAEWLPPVAIGRRVELEQMHAHLGPGPAMGLRGALVLGGSGTGTSTVARLAARRCADTLRRDAGGPPPLLVTVRVRWCRGTQGVAGALLQRLDEGFEPRGFPVN